MCGLSTPKLYPYKTKLFSKEINKISWEVRRIKPSVYTSKSQTTTWHNAVTWHKALIHIFKKVRCNNMFLYYFKVFFESYILYERIFFSTIGPNKIRYGRVFIKRVSGISKLEDLIKEFWDTKPIVPSTFYALVAFQKLVRIGT
jgi:hypothetical protein